ncbi:MAG: IS110 family transposase [Lewinellaceae bacterium]|nr:IS110 family transposase [Lewinellaceae bacterium]
MAKAESQINFSLVNPNAAGIDVGSRSHWVSMGLLEGQSKEFGVFTEDLHKLCQWLKVQGITTVAMESTGFYWKHVFVMLQSYGMETYLVNASFTKNIRGRKPSDLSDSQWIWKLHSVGLLPASFQPDHFTEELRTYVRHRKRLIEGASQCVNRMQKCLTLMNIRLPVVLSDITGKSGTAIIQAILSGERDGKKLALLADRRVKADKETIAKALTGFWQECHLFELKQHWQMYEYHRQQLKECDEKIDALLQQRVQQTNQAELVYEPKKKSGARKMPPTSK